MKKILELVAKAEALLDEEYGKGENVLHICEDVRTVSRKVRERIRMIEEYNASLKAAPPAPSPEPEK